ncbi:MAG: AtpZ/AtpI family protein [Eubacteriales bacterium]|nr:AtpZ/AtpI family protein [Eubacteriales bacterium]
MQYKKSVFRSLAMVTQLGLSVITPVFLCIFIGYQIDSRFETKILVPMLILGVLAGGRSAWVLAKATLEQEKKEDERIRRERMSQSARAGVSKPKQPSRIRREGQAADSTEREADKDGMA